MKKHHHNQRFTKLYSFLNSLEAKINPGILLLAVALAAMICANSSSLQAWYTSLWETRIFLGTSSFNLFSHQDMPFTLLQFVNDVLMTIFFFTVGLEIKREILVGELSTVKQATLPIIAAFGGMIFPILIFSIFGKLMHFDTAQFKGIAVPMATDIAFSIGVLSLLGKRVPLSLKIFLLALAIADDIGGIVVIATFYSQFTSSSVLYLLAALCCLGVLWIGNRWRVNSKWFYIIFGVVVWYLFLHSGIHPTIAGVLVAFLIPARPHLDIHSFTNNIQVVVDHLKKSTQNNTDNQEIILSHKQIEQLSMIESASDYVISPLQDFEDNLIGFVNFFVMPVFAFANAGVVFDMDVASMFSGVTIAIMAGLVLGKVLGIYTFTWLAIKLKISKLSAGMNFKNILGIAMLGGIGFTVALFLAGLSYPNHPDLLNQAKLGIIAGSVISGVLGYFLLKFTLKNQKR